MLVPEVEARSVLRGQRIRLRVLAPHGSWFGCGRLRVLRLKIAEPVEGDRTDKEIELTAGYESYQP